jgi:hypothetical protein
MLTRLQPAAFAWRPLRTAVAASLGLAALPARAAAPVVDDLIVAPKRDALAWTVHERGARNVVVWSGGTVRQITQSTADDGEQLGGLSFAPDASPNPTAPAKRQPRKILLTSVASGATIELGNGHDPAISPKGDRVAATGDAGKTWTAAKADTLFTVRGSAGAPLWSPDGSRLGAGSR